MPTVSLFRDDLFAALGRELTEEEFNKECFQFGLELDDVTSEKERMTKEKGAEAAADADDRVIWAVDIPANRHDLLCMEGLIKALQIFEGKSKGVQYVMRNHLSRNVMADGISIPGKSANVQLFVKKGVSEVRPFMVSAILRNIKFTPASLQSFIDYQDKLHQNICRRRTLASIGTHDMDTIQGPFYYDAWDPKDINFVPLKETKKWNSKELLEHYKKEHQQLKEYVDIIYDKPKYPVVLDSNNVVCSLPPIINSEHSKCTIDTKNVFIDLTACDYTKANIVLNQVCAAFSAHCEEEFTIEPVEVVYEEDYPSNMFVKSGEKGLYPKMEPTKFEVDVNRMKRQLGLQALSTEEVQDYLTKMMLPSRKKAEKSTNDGGDLLEVDVPCTRSDVMHECDMTEDLAIAYGYNNLKADIPELATEIRAQPINTLTDLLRGDFAASGFNECLNFALCAKEEIFDAFRRKPDHSLLDKLAKGEYSEHEYLPNLPAVHLANPKTECFNVCRTSLLPGLLKTMNHNRKNVLPLKLFEVSDCVVQDKTSETGARNQRRCAAMLCSKDSQFEVIHGLIDNILAKLNCQAKAALVILLQDAGIKQNSAVDTQNVTSSNTSEELKKFAEAAKKLGWADRAKELAECVGTKQKSEEKAILEKREIRKPECTDAECKKIRRQKLYDLVENKDPAFIDGMQASIVVDGVKIGICGVLRPDVTDLQSKAWNIKNPCCVMEMNIEPFLKWLEE